MLMKSTRFSLQSFSEIWEEKQGSKIVEIVEKKTYLETGSVKVLVIIRGVWAGKAMVLGWEREMKGKTAVQCL